MPRTHKRKVTLAHLDAATLGRLRELQIDSVAPALGIEISKGKAMCFAGHDRKSPSFTIGKNKISWKCYGCGEYGDAISLVQKVFGFDFKEACTWLSRQPGISDGSWSSSPAIARSRQSKSTLIRAPAPSSPTEADPPVYSWLVERCAPVTDPRGTDYLDSHGIPAAVASAFGVVELKDPARAYQALERQWGQARLQRSGLSGNRRSLLWSGYSILFPFYADGRVEYVQIRCLESDRKFIGPKGVLKPIFNRARLKQLRPGQQIHICEGIPDTLALEASGLHAVGILGATSFRAEWVDDFLSFDLVGVPDADAGGKKFSESLASAFKTRSKSIRFVRPPTGKDACDVISKVIDAKLP